MTVHVPRSAKDGKRIAFAAAGKVRSSRTMGLAAILGAGFALTLGVPRAGAQRLTPSTLRAADATAVESFAHITSVRELDDGRVLVADIRDQRLVALDFRRFAVEEVGRVGEGPGEYTEVTKISALPGDSSLVEDRRALRWVILHRTHAVKTLRSWSNGWRGATLAGADAQGRVLELSGFHFRLSGDVPQSRQSIRAETVAVLLHRRDASRVGTKPPARSDTVARLKGAGSNIRMVRRGSFRDAPLFYQLWNPLAVEEQAQLFLDGWIALVTINPYRVEWRTPNGRRIVGPPLPLERVPVDDTQKRASIRRTWPRVEPPFTAGDMPLPWPITLPPFPNDALFAIPDGRLLIRRMSSALLDGLLYDIVDRGGQLAARLALKAHERIVGFGARSVYVVSKDEDDAEWLSRHPWP